MNVWWPNTPVPETEGGKFAGFGFVGAKARWVGVGAKARWVGASAPEAERAAGSGGLSLLRLRLL
eukprot:523753-Pyramimonas_sp.AAC.1